MHRFRYVLISLMLLSSCVTFAQIPKYIFNEVSGEEYPRTDFKVAVRTASQWAGAYHFGESEGEWDLILIVSGDIVIVQVWRAEWAKDIYTKQDSWQRSCTTFNNATLAGDKLSFGKYRGMFVNAADQGKTIPALLLYGDPGSRNYVKDTAEAGFNTATLAVLFADKERHSLSQSVMQESYFQGRSKQELKIMRNIIYANYGMIFQPGGDMEKYFRQKSWYTAFRKNVTDCLTTIELKNIETIQRLEKL